MATNSAPGLTIRSLTQYEFCPRLFWYMYSAGLMAINEHVAEGLARHSRVADPTMAARKRVELDKIKTRSVDVGSETLGIHGKVDVIEEDAGGVRVVEYKKGRPPKPASGLVVWPADAVQVCAQTMALEEVRGEAITEGILYYIEARKRVPIAIDGPLRERTREVIRRAAATVILELPPEPMPPSNRKQCAGCSLVGICQPEETELWKSLRAEDEAEAHLPRVVPSDPQGAVVYVTGYGTRIGLESDHLVIRPRDDPEVKLPIGSLEQVVAGPATSFSGAAIQALAEGGVALIHLDGVERVAAMTLPPHPPNVHLRRAQIHRADEPEFCLAAAKAFVTAKVRNQRALLMRTLRSRQGVSVSASDEIRSLKRIIAQIPEAESVPSLLGLEGTAARVYFSLFAEMLTPAVRGMGFDFEGRNRRPPRDPVNALLSFAYGLLTKDCVAVSHMVGFEVGIGFFHGMGRARPALALDLMEEFRPIVADSVVLMALNNGELAPADFLQAENACILTPQGRKAFIQAYQRRRAQSITHPLFGYELSMARAIESQARQLAKFVTGELPAYHGLVLR